MLARLQQFITLALLSAAAAWSFRAITLGAWWHAAAGLVLAAAGYASILGLEFLWMFVVNRRDSIPGPTGAQVITAWWAEVLAVPRIFCWQQPFRSALRPDRLDGRPGQRGLLLIHGFFCNRGLWNRWYPRLADAGIPHVGLDLESVFGDIDGHAARIDAAVASLRARTGLAPVVVAHSMGGLAVRAWLRSLGGCAAAERVHHIVTLGSPHHGTEPARLGLFTSTRQMRRHSPWIEALAAAETPALLSRFTCVYGPCDNIVFPTSSAILPGAARRAIPACAHVHMVDHPAAFELVRRLLHDGEAIPSDPGPSAASTDGAVVD